MPVSQVRVTIVELIGAGKLKGHIDSETYYQEREYRIRCQLCDKELVNPLHYTQCDVCKRFICEDCGLHIEGCPMHPEAPSKMVKMPLRCPTCNTLYTDLNDLQGNTLICPICATTLLTE